MDFQNFTTTSFASNIGQAIGKYLPSRFAYPLIRLIANIVSTRKDSVMVRAVRANQWVVQGEDLSSKELDKAVKSVFRQTARCYYDLYRTLDKPDLIQELSPSTPQIDELIELSQSWEHGAMVIGAHVSNFDLIMFANAQRGFRALALSSVKETGGISKQNQIRATTGLEITPVGIKSLSQAIKRMKKGGFVITAIDRPLGHDAMDLEFFGRPSRIPSGPVRLAMKADVPVYVVTGQTNSSGKYIPVISEPIYMVSHSKRNFAIRNNAKSVLNVLEEQIKSVPEQWQMFFPIWPQVLDNIP